MGWLILLLLAGATFLLLWRVAGFSRGALQLAGAAILFAVAGYAWLGSPFEPGAPAPEKADVTQPDSAFATQRQALMGNFGSGTAWLNFADALHRMGYDRSAVTAIKSGIAHYPKDPDLWVGLGNALVLHAGGMVTPAAIYAFQHARQLQPKSTAAQFYLGLAYAQMGNYDAAEATWQALLAGAPADASWRPAISKEIQALEAARAGR